MGTTRNSSNMKMIIISLLNQINALLLSTNADNELENETIQVLRDRLLTALVELTKSNSGKNKIIILLDSIDQLSRQDHNLLDWMLFRLPKNVKFIYSVLPDYEGILQKIKSKLDYLPENYLTISDLSINEAKNMIAIWLRDDGRTLTHLQNNIIHTCLKNSNHIDALHVKLLFYLSSKWTSSYKVPNEFKSCITIKDTIKYIFKQLEALYGKILFSRCLFYLTLFEYNGIGESELEDILSIDDEVLNSVFQYHHPPVRRFLIVLWLNIYHVLKNYITSKETDEILVISW